MITCYLISMIQWLWLTPPIYDPKTCVPISKTNVLQSRPKGYMVVWDELKGGTGVDWCWSWILLMNYLKISNEELRNLEEDWSRDIMMWLCRGWTKWSYVYTNLPLSGSHNYWVTIVFKLKTNGIIYLFGNYLSEIINQS